MCYCSIVFVVGIWTCGGDVDETRIFESILNLLRFAFVELPSWRTDRPTFCSRQACRRRRRIPDSQSPALCCVLVFEYEIVVQESVTSNSLNYAGWSLTFNPNNEYVSDFFECRTVRPWLGAVPESITITTTSKYYSIFIPTLPLSVQ